MKTFYKKTFHNFPLHFLLSSFVCPVTFLNFQTASIYHHLSSPYIQTNLAKCVGEKYEGHINRVRYCIWN